MSNDKFTITLGGQNGWGGLCPGWTENTYPFYGNKNQASDITDVDLRDPNVLTQGPGIANLTSGDHSGELGENLVVAILKHATSSNVSYACSADKVFKLSDTAVLNGNFPKSITAGTANVATDLIYYKSKVYVFWNDTGVDGDIGMLTNDTTWDDNWGCYKDDTEVLTVDGWKLIKDVKSNEKVYSLNPKTQEVEIAVNTETIDKPYSGEMIRFISEGIDVSVTPDHKMYAGFRKRVKEQEKRDINYKIVRADSLLDKTNFKLKKNAIWNGKITDNWEIPAYSNGVNYKQEKKKIPIKTFLTFLGFYISEGYCTKTGKQIGISQSKEKNYYIWKIIKENLDELGFSYSENKRDDGFTINDKQLCEYIKDFVSGKSYKKYVPKEILGLDKSLLIYLYEAMMLGDGDDTGRYYTSSLQLRDDFIELVNKLGWSPTLREYDNRGQKALNGIVKHISYIIGVNKRKNEQVFNHHKKQKLGATVIKEQYSGNIVCLVLDKNHIMLVRRNGKQLWCGNSTIPTGKAQLQDAPHYAIQGGDDVMYFTNGIYIGTYNGTTLSPTALDFWTDSETVSVTWNNNRVKVAMNRPNITGSNFNQSGIYTWNGVSSSWEGDPIEVQGETGALYTKNGITFVWWRDSITTGGYNFGYISGETINPIGRYSGSLPNQAQVGEYDGHIAWLSSSKLFLWGAKDTNIEVKMFPFMSAKYTTSVGGFGAPFGTPLIASKQYATFTANATTDIVTSAAHGLSDDDTVRLTTTNTLPAGLAITTTYYVITATTNTFQLSSSKGGSKIDITDTGTGTHTWNQYSLGKASGYSTSASYSTIAFPVSSAESKGQIDLMEIEFETLASGAKVDTTMTYDKGASSQSLTQVAHSATDSSTRRKILDRSYSVEDIRIDLSWANGSTTNPVKIRSLFIKGHHTQDN